MKEHTTSDSSSIFLTGAILLANMDYSGLLDYAFRAILGGAIWMIFKIGTDYLSERIKNNNSKDLK